MSSPVILREQVDTVGKASLPVLEVKNLRVEFRRGDEWFPVVDDVSFSVAQGEALGLVGESGSGKTQTVMAVMGLAQTRGARVSASAINLDGRDISNLSRSEWSKVRGNDVAMIFQQPTRSLNPAFTVGEQIAEVLRKHRGQSRKEAWAGAVALLDRVGIARAAERASEYPHTFSGGMCQRVMIAIALACHPKLIIADEPTTALDVTVQAKVLDLLRELQRELGAAIIFITHDLGVIAEMSERTAVMYAGQVVEISPTRDIFLAPVHPYTRGLVASVPKVGSTKRLSSIAGVVPPAHDMPPGCRFEPRCHVAIRGTCDTVKPTLELIGNHHVRCVRAHELGKA